ncbi:hypothetical protein [Pseudomonas gingeri]|uniref:hypothetical protein n=1 Tax=Pseudomonas gingeri TaxID=117681 RepID=UPI00210930C4|nr:hypothetical protein [Pseudomonas gingeri]
MNKLLFDYAANRYEVSGDTLDNDALAYLGEIQGVLEKYKVAFPELHLVGQEMRAVQGGKTYSLGSVHTQGANEQRIIYPCFREEFLFDFIREIPSFSLWNDMDGELLESYAQLKSDLIKNSAIDEHQANLLLVRDFIAMVNPQVENFAAGKAELDFLQGLISLHQVGVTQAKVRSFQGVSLPSRTASGTGSRYGRAIEHTLNLLVGDDVADIKLYQLISAQSPDSIASMRLVSQYYTRWKGRINTRQEFSDFLLSINLESMPPSLFAGFRQLSALRRRRVTHVLLTLPNEGSAAWRTMLLNIHGEFDQFRRRALGNILSPGGRHYLELGADYSISNSDLVIKYSSSAAGGVDFDGVVNVMAHGRDIERRLSGYPEKVATWLYSNILSTYTAAGFGKLKAINFQACQIPQALATYITCILLERASPHFGNDRIPNVLVISSPRSSLVLTSQMLLGRPRANTWQDQHFVFPGHVLKAFRHLIDHSSQIQVAIGENLNWHFPSVESDSLSYIAYLRATHVLEVSRISANDGDSYINKAMLSFIRAFSRAALDTRNTGFEECAQLIGDRFPEAVGDIHRLVAVTSIDGGGQSVK